MLLDVSEGQAQRIDENAGSFVRFWVVHAISEDKSRESKLEIIYRCPTDVERAITERVEKNKKISHGLNTDQTRIKTIGLSVFDPC